MNLKALTRREFLTVAGAASSLSIAYFILRPQTTFASVLPPGARTPAFRFNARCSRCGKCVAICPREALHQNTLGLPYIDGLTGWCDFCMQCAAACPTGALQSIEPETARIGRAAIDEHRCIAWIRSGCRLCYEKCFELRQAIHIDAKYRPSVDADKCNGCGACVNVCPQSDSDGQDRRHGKAIALKVV